MSKITEREPAHWHNQDGRHNMADPRTMPGYDRKHWDDDEKKYVEHLEVHSTPTPLESDSDHVRRLFELIEANEEANAKLRELITTYRERDGGQRQ